MLTKSVKRALKNIYKQSPIRNYMGSMQVVWHEVVRGEDYARFAIFTYGDASCDFDSWDDLLEWVRREYRYSRGRFPAWDCSGLTFMRDYDINKLPKMDNMLGNACAVIFKYSVDV